jgi:hypothetical protein
VGEALGRALAVLHIGLGYSALEKAQVASGKHFSDDVLPGVAQLRP